MKNTKRVCLLIIIVMLAISSMLFTACDKGPDDSVYAGGKKFAVSGDTVIMGFPFSLIMAAALDKENTYFEFGENGYLHAQLQTKQGLVGNLGGIFALIGMKQEEVEEMLTTMDLSGMVNSYVEPMFPGFTDKLKDGDLEGALGLIKSSLGFNITGLDFDNEQIVEAVKYIGENMSLPANLLDIIPEDTVLTLTLDTQYARRKVTTTAGETIDAVYLGYKVKDNPSTQPFGVFTESKVDGKTALALRIEFMNIDIGLIEA